MQEHEQNKEKKNYISIDLMDQLAINTHHMMAQLLGY